MEGTTNYHNSLKDDGCVWLEIEIIVRGRIITGIMLLGRKFCLDI